MYKKYLNTLNDLKIYLYYICTMAEEFDFIPTDSNNWNYNDY